MPDLTQAQRNAVSELLRISQVTGDLGSCLDMAGHRLYLVGGSVHDAMLGGLGHDLDFTTPARPGEAHATPRDFTPTTWGIGRDFGTIGAMKKEGGKEWQIEVTTFRAGVYESGSRKPVVAFGERIEEDLVRRDFTANAMAVDIVAGEFIDPWDGLRDPTDGVLRTLASVGVSFGDDPLCMMRATWFASRLGSRVVPEVQDVMREMAKRIIIVSMGHVQAELTGLLLTDSPREGLDLLVRTGAAEHFLPELPALCLERDEHMHHKDVHAYSLTVLEQVIDLEEARGHQPDIVNRLAALLYDIDKPATRRSEGSKVTFHHHDVAGAKLVIKRLKALKCPTAMVKLVAKLVELHLRFHSYGEASWSGSAVCRYVRDAGNELECLRILTCADCTIHNRSKATQPRRNYEELEWCIDELTTQEEIKAIRPDLDGAQIMEILGIVPGPEAGKAYKSLLNYRTGNGPLLEDEARDLLLTRWKDQQP